MSNKTFSILLLLGLLPGTVGLRAQSSDPFNPYSAIAPSAETFEMVRCGGLTPSLYSGAMSFSVPLFTYQDPDFTVPVSLDYNFDGFKPAQHSGTVGYGWALTCGGTITREVRGIPDDDWYYGASDRITRGYYWTANSSHAVVSREINDTTRWGTLCHSGGAGIISDAVTSRINPYAHTPLQSTVTIDEHGMIEIIDAAAYDMTPDIYHFHFLGHGGDFMFMPDGTVRVFNSDLPHGEFRVEFQPPTSIRWTTDAYWCSFTVTTGDGTRYTFGGDYNTIEYSRSSTTQGVSNYSWSAVAFRLKQIQAPNGRTVTFNYSQQKQSSLLSQPYYTPKFVGYNNAASQLYRRHTRTYFPVLSSVSVDNVERIRFTYAAKTLNEDSSAYFDSFSSASTGAPGGIYVSSDALRLSTVELLDDTGAAVQRATLVPAYADSGTPKMLLSSVTTTKGGTHAFQYNLAYTLPKNDTGSTDHWGYWNSGVGFDPRTDVIPNAGRFAQMVNGSSKKDPDPARGAIDALTRVTYPTGGTTDIAYEGNTAAKGLEEEGVIYEPLSGPFAVGGVRVCSLIDRPSASAVPDTTLFQYAEGFLYGMPRYALSFPIDYTPPQLYDPDVPEITVTGYNGDVDYAVSGDRLVGYGSVTRIHPDRSRTQTVFTSYDNGFGDGFGLNGDGQYCAYPVIVKWCLFSEGDRIENPAFEEPAITVCASVDRRNMRGRPLSVTVRDADGTLKARTEYTYAADTVALNWIYVNNVDAFIALPWRSLSPAQTSETTTDYLAGGGTVSVRELDYNTAGQVACQAAWSPDCPGDTLKTYFRYLHEAGLPGSASALPGALYMAARTRTTGGTQYLLDGVRYSYGNVAAHIKPAAVEKFRIDSPVPLASPASWSSVAGALPVDGTLRFDYDTGTLFPNRVRMPGDSWVTYAWTGLYPTSKQENGSGNCSLYSWQDQVGLKTLTSPAGSAETYGYDARGRLRVVRDADGAAVTVYDYRFANDQNE